MTNNNFIIIEQTVISLDGVKNSFKNEFTENTHNLPIQNTKVKTKSIHPDTFKKLLNQQISKLEKHSKCCHICSRKLEPKDMFKSLHKHQCFLFCSLNCMNAWSIG